MSFRKTIKITALSLVAFLLLAVAGMAGFIYKARYGFNFYESDPPELPAGLAN